MGSKQTTPSPPATSSSNYSPLDTTTQYSYMESAPSSLDLRLSSALHIPPPIRPKDEHDSQKIYAFYRSRNLLCFPAVLILLIVCLAVGLSLDAGLNDSWSGQGSNRFNDRQVPVSLVHSKTLHLEEPTFLTSWNHTISSTPAIWNGRVFATSRSGSVAAFGEDTGEILWSKDICQDVFGLDVNDCIQHVEVNGKYYSVATPTIWGKDNIVVSIRKPPTLLVLESESGRVVSRATLDENPLVELTQSGTIYEDNIYIGTSISDADAETDKQEGCAFVGRFFRWNLKDMRAVWSVQFDDSQHEFTGMRIAGSSPPISLDMGVVAISVGPAICTPSWYQTCIASLDPENGPFNASLYKTRGEQCHYTGTASEALFNSIVVLDIDNGAKVWWQKIIGYDAWSNACADERTFNGVCETTGDCNIQNNIYLNCPTEEESWTRGLINNDFADDPVLTHPADGMEMLYVAQTSGIVYAFTLAAQQVSSSLSSDSSLSHFSWATSIIKSSQDGSTGITGIAVNKGYVYVSLKNENQNLWTIGETYQNTTCGGWAALNRDTGDPVWYTSPSQSYCVHSYAAPSVTNDVVLVTSSFTVGPDTRGLVQALSTKTGQPWMQFENNESFGEQGVSIHGRCVYTGSDGWNVLGWCIQKEDLVH